MKQAT